MTNRLLLGALLLVLLPAASAADDASRDRRWGLGWDEGLTLRHRLGDWELSLVAGPDDWLSESDSRGWDTDEPDSLQGRDTNHDEYRRESGFVRLRAGRVLAREGKLAFQAQGSLQYLWSDRRDEYNNFYSAYATFRRTDTWSESWTITGGFGLVWRPLAALSIETAFRLAYTWEDVERVERYVHRDLEPPLESDRVEVTQTRSSYRRFEDRGWTGLGSLGFVFWF